MPVKDNPPEAPHQPPLLETMSLEQREHIIRLLARLIHKQLAVRLEQQARDKEDDSPNTRRQDTAPSS